MRGVALSALARGVGAAVVLLLLGGCLSRSDSLAPIVSISEPRNGAVQSAENLRVRGYAMDDEGVVAIRVNGSDLLDSAFLAGERGKQLIPFEFTFQNLREGESTSVIEVVDSSGRTSVLTFTLQIDVTPPTLELIAVTPLGDGPIEIGESGGGAAGRVAQETPPRADPA